MDTMNDGAGPEMPAQDRALAALTDLLEQIGEDAGQAWFRDGPNDDAVFADCTKRAEIVVRAIIALPAVTLHGAAEKVRAVRSGTALALLPTDLIDALGLDMASDVTRLRAPTDMEVAGHA